MDCWWQLSSVMNPRFMLTTCRTRPPNPRVVVSGYGNDMVRVVVRMLLARVRVTLRLGLEMWLGLALAPTWSYCYLQ